MEDMTNIKKIKSDIFKEDRENILGFLLLVPIFLEVKLIIGVVAHLFNNVYNYSYKYTPYEISNDYLIYIFLPIINIILGMIIINLDYKKRKNKKINTVIYILIIFMFASVYGILKSYHKIVYEVLLLALLIIYRIISYKYYRKLVGYIKAEKYKKRGFIAFAFEIIIVLVSRILIYILI